MSSKTIYDKVQEIKTEKDSKIIPENIKKDVTVLGVTGTLEPSADINIFTQTTEPTTKEGIWLDTNNTFDNIEFTNNVVAGEEWNTGKMAQTTDLPITLYSGFGVKIDTDVYFGGTQAGYSQAMYKYDTLTDTYTQLSNIPSSFNTGVAAAVGTDIYLFTGNTYKYDTTTDTYTQLTNIAPSTDQGSAVAIGTDIYLFGARYSKAATKYNTLSDTYTQLTAIPIAGKYFFDGSVAAVGTDIYLFGGYYNGYSAYKYDTTTDTYTQLTDLPSGFALDSGDSHDSAISVGTNVYLFLGTTAYRYDTITDTYTQLTNIPYQYLDGSLVTVNNEIYLLGGRGTNKIQLMDVITVDFEDNSIIVQNGTTYKTQLYTNNKVEGRVLNYFSNVYTYTDLNGLEQIYDTYYGNGTSWIQIT